MFLCLFRLTQIHSKMWKLCFVLSLHSLRARVIVVDGVDTREHIDSDTNARVQCTCVVVDKQALGFREVCDCNIVDAYDDDITLSHPSIKGEQQQTALLPEGNRHTTELSGTKKPVVEDALTLALTGLLEDWVKRDDDNRTSETPESATPDNDTETSSEHTTLDKDTLTLSTLYSFMESEFREIENRDKQDELKDGLTCQSFNWFMLNLGSMQNALDRIDRCQEEQGSVLLTDVSRKLEGLKAELISAVSRIEGMKAALVKAALSPSVPNFVSVMRQVDDKDSRKQCKTIRQQANVLKTLKGNLEWYQIVIEQFNTPGKSFC